MALNPPPDTPLITDPSTFASRAQDWVVWQADVLYPFLEEGASLLGESTSATSTTSNSIGTGSKSFTVETGKGFIQGMSLSIARTSSPTNRMFCVVTSYNSGTGALVVTSQAFEGSGTYTDWSIAQSQNGVPETTTLAGRLSNLGLSVTMAANAVTIALKGADGNDPSLTNRVNISFRNATLTNGQSSNVSVTSALSTVISSGSTGGTVSGVPSRIWVAAILVSGATELAWFNSVSGDTIAPINENGLISTTAEGGAGGADSAQVWYSTTARSNVPPVVLGYFDSVQAMAGTWASAATTINVNPKNRPCDVLQKQFAIKRDTQTHSTTYTDVTGLSLSLTPRAAANKVAYHCVLNIGVTGGGGAVAKAIRDSTDLFLGDTAGSRIRASTSVGTLNNNVTAATSIYGIDSPNTTSAVTYKVAFQGFGGTAVYINRSPADTDSTSFMRTASTLYVEEISV